MLNLRNILPSTLTESEGSVFLVNPQIYSIINLWAGRSSTFRLHYAFSSDPINPLQTGFHSFLQRMTHLSL